MLLFTEETVGKTFLFEEEGTYVSRRNHKTFCMMCNDVNVLPWMEKSPEVNPIET